MKRILSIVPILALLLCAPLALAASPPSFSHPYLTAGMRSPFAAPLPSGALSNGLSVDSNGYLLINASGGTGYPLSSGLLIDASGNLLVDCATGCSGGSVTFAGDLSGTSSSQSVIGINGTKLSTLFGSNAGLAWFSTSGVPSVATAANIYSVLGTTPAFPGAISVGTNGGTAGVITYFGATSGNQPVGCVGVTCNAFGGTSVAADFGKYYITNMFAESVAPTVSAGPGWGSGATVPANNGTISFTVNVGTGASASTGTVTMPAAAHGYNCNVQDYTTPANQTRQSGAGSTTTVPVTNYNSGGTATAWAASDVLGFNCTAY